MTTEDVLRRLTDALMYPDNEHHVRVRAADLRHMLVLMAGHYPFDPDDAPEPENEEEE